MQVVVDRPAAHVRLRDEVAYSADLKQKQVEVRCERERAAAADDAGRFLAHVALPSMHWSSFAIRLNATLHNEFFDGHASEVRYRVRIPAHSKVLAGGEERD